tara:strand:+ start:505 stop:3849 length:3345 start_codon:yes stop_codon:yes gene_type:complete
MAKISRSQLEKDLQDYKDSLEASKGLPNSVVENNIKYNPSTGQLEYSMPNDLNENQFNENLPTDAANARVYVTYDISKIDTGRYAAGTIKGGDAVRGFTTTSDDLAGMKTSTSTVSGKWTKNQRKRNQPSDATKTTYTLTVDVTDIIEPVGGMGYKSWARTERDLSSHDQKKRAKDVIRRITNAMNSSIPDIKGYNDNDDYVYADWVDTTNLTSGQRKKQSPGYFFRNKGQSVNRTAYEGMRDNMNKVNDNNHNVALYNEFNPKFNDYAKQINDFNREYNSVKDVKKQTYDDAIQIANQTKGADYTDQRDKIRLTKKLEEAGISAEDSQKILGDVESAFKDFYRGEKLEKFDFGYGQEQGYASTKGKPLYGEFNANYYRQQTLPNQSLTEQEKWNEAVANDDIDIIERFGEGSGAETGYYLWRYGQQRGAGELRGNEADPLEAAEEFVEKAPTDAEMQQIRDRMLNIEEDDPETLINDVAYIKEAYEEAKQAKADGTANRFIDAAGNYLNVDNPDEFLLVFQQSDNEEDQRAYNELKRSGLYITELEDAITGVVGEEALVQTKKFGALTQNVLTDTFDELRKAKAKEQELALMGQFSTFGEIMDVNKSLSDSLLGDSGIGGYLPFMGKDSGFDQKTLEKQLSGVTGINNNVVYNWQEWFDDSIKKNYSEFEDDYLELGYTKEEAENAAEQQINIQKSFAQSYVNDYLKPRFDESRSMNEFVEYLDVRQEEQNPFQTQSLLDAVNTVGELQAKTYLDQIRDSAVDKKFNSDFYFDPVGAGMSVGLQNQYDNQKTIVEADWEKARNKPNEIADPLNPGQGTWAELAYRYGADVNDKQQFAQLHYQVKGKNPNYKFDPAEDVINAGKVKDHIYTNILPKLVDEAGRQPTVFGQFIRPEEFADDMIEGLDPDQPEEWNYALEQVGLSDFQGTAADLKNYIAETFRTGSAADIRSQLKYLNEKREKPTQELLGVEYIQREEDYTTDNKLEGDTQLFKVFQDAGYDGSEDDFYENVFPDLDPGSQTILSQVGETGKINIEGLGGTDYRNDPFAAFGVVSQLSGDEGGLFGNQEREEKEEDDEESSYFTFDVDYDDDEEDYKSKKGSEILSQFTKGFSSFI